MNNCFAIISGNTQNGNFLLNSFFSEVVTPFKQVYNTNFSEDAHKAPGDFILLAQLTADELVIATRQSALVPGKDYTSWKIGFSNLPWLHDKKHTILRKERSNQSWSQVCYRKELLPSMEKVDKNRKKTAPI